ncbi:MAG TPA: adenosylcobinamide-phosphate synthase CbiB [Ideonella sp.]|nr:adenosylcobinamide-phosphate synthase CbiB [Ideonella sp.]
MSGAALVPGLALLLAWAWDLRFGEPRNAWHPVAWLGSLLAPLGRRLAAWPPAAAFCGGALAWLVLAGGLGAAAWGWQQWATPWPLWLAVPALALVLKPMFAWRMLRDEVAAVDQALGVSLEAARAQLARLVSRDVSTASADEVREAAIATLAENLNDSLVAPLCWFVLAGLPGAVVYRLANTADAMWGYRGRYEWAGKWAARADDLLSWLPARLTALLLWRAGGWRLLRAEAGQTPSPNGGWPMGAMALRLGVRLRKTGVYVLNGSAPSPGAADLPRALAAAGQAAGLALLLACAAVFGSAAWRA